MTPSTFAKVLKSEVARVQTLHPELEGKLARAHALILQGMCTPSTEDPAIGRVLSSDGQTWYTVNGTCSCQAGQYGHDCKHFRGSWPLLVMFKAFRYIKAFSWSRNIPGYSVRASPIRLERVATR